MSVNVQTNNGLNPVAGNIDTTLLSRKISQRNIRRSVEECVESTSAVDVAGADTISELNENLTRIGKIDLLWSGEIRVGESAILSNGVKNYREIIVEAKVAGIGSNFTIVIPIVQDVIGKPYSNSVTAYNSFGSYMNSIGVTIINDNRIDCTEEFHLLWSAPTLTRIYGVG